MPKILVVDDSLADRKLAGGLLEKNPKFDISFAENGQLAVDQLNQGLPDLVLTDLQMPELNGLQLVSEIQRNFPQVPVILMTATGSEKIAVQALQKGAASYVRKASLARSLVDTVERVLVAAGEEEAHAEAMRQLVSNEFIFNLDMDLSLLGPLVKFLQKITRMAGVCDATESVRLGVALDRYAGRRRCRSHDARRGAERA